MRIGMQTWGSHGDIRSLLALAGGLQARGHEVTLAVTSTDGTDYSPTAAALGVRLVDVASQKIALAEKDPETSRAIADEPDIIKQMQLIITRLLLPAEAEMYAAAEALCGENQVIIGHYFCYPLQTAAEKTQRPYCTVTLNPSFIPSQGTPPSGLPNLGKAANRTLWGLAKSKINETLGPTVNRLRRQNGLADARDLIADVWLSQVLNLIAVSPEVCRKRPDWSEVHQVCGFFNSNRIENEGRVSPELEEFLKGGSPPVFMTFGSMVPDQTEVQSATASLLGGAAQLAGCRAIVQTSLAANGGFTSSGNVLYLKATPHTAVFPRCTAVVHHGGAGTMQTVMLAGVPSVVVPHISDQFFWAREAKRLGIAPEPLPRTKLTQKALAQRIKAMLASDPMRERARKIGTAVRNEAGVEKAAQLVNEKFTG
jgi:sterol 3beta-glucosyltransferase